MLERARQEEGREREVEVKLFKRISLAALLVVVLTAAVGSSSASAAGWKSGQYKADVQGEFTYLDFELGLYGLFSCANGSSFEEALPSPAPGALTTQTNKDANCKYYG